MTLVSRTIEVTRDDVLEDGVFLCARFADRDPVVEACRAAVRGGLRVLEITLTTPGALQFLLANGNYFQLVADG